MKRPIIVLEDSKGIIIKKNKKIQKFIYKNSRNDSVAAGSQIGVAYLQRVRRHNIGALRTYRTYILSHSRTSGHVGPYVGPFVFYLGVYLGVYLAAYDLHNYN